MKEEKSHSRDLLRCRNVKKNDMMRCVELIIGRKEIVLCSSDY